MPRIDDNGGYKILLGSLRTLVTWQKPNQTRSTTTGQQISNWSDLATRYTQMIAIKSQEKLNELPQGQSMFKVTQRYLPNLDISCRMKLNGQYYKITGLINVDQRSIWQEVFVTLTSTTP